MCPESLDDKKSANATESTFCFFQISALPIPKMGLFFSDPFFRDVWLDFQEAVRDVLSRMGDLPGSDDPVAQYRDLRTRDLREVSQAVRWTEDEAAHKVS